MRKERTMADLDTAGATDLDTDPDADTNTFPIFHLKISDEHTIVLSRELRRRLGVEAGGTVAISIAGGQGFVYKTTKAEAAQPVVDEEIPEIEGLLRDYFADREDVRRFLEEERGG